MCSSMRSGGLRGTSTAAAFLGRGTSAQPASGHDLDLSGEGDPECNLASSAVSGQSPPAGPQSPKEASRDPRATAGVTNERQRLCSGLAPCSGANQESRLRQRFSWGAATAFRCRAQPPRQASEATSLRSWIGSVAVWRSVERREVVEPLAGSQESRRRPIHGSKSSLGATTSNSFQPRRNRA